MAVGTRKQVELAVLDAVRNLLGWLDAARQGDVEQCRQYEEKYFALMEDNRLSEEWLEVYMYLVNNSAETTRSEGR